METFELLVIATALLGLDTLAGSPFLSLFAKFARKIHVKNNDKRKDQIYDTKLFGSPDYTCEDKGRGKNKGDGNKRDL